MDIQDLLDDDASIASLPGVYHQFQEAMSSTNSSFAEIGEIILYDSGLSARLLQIVNSAYYGFPDRIDKISHAISIVGTAQLSDLLLSTVVMDKFNSIPNSVINMESFWQHAIACGLIARKLASYNENLDPEKIFVAGMLHDIGQIVLCRNFPELTLKILLETQSQDQQLHELEDQEFGFNHAELGGKLLEKWNLSEFHIETTTFHHAPIFAPHYSMEASILHSADTLANILKLGCSGESIAPSTFEEGEWDKIQHPDHLKLPDFMEEISKTYEETVSLFLQVT
ncbi:MAG: HDOD domain-containing protein [Nitrospina sp.]|nr:HDOD domain-containing protein [Nitrospina sp.]